MVGYDSGETIAETARRTEEVFAAVREIEPDTILVCHGAAMETPEDAQYMLDHTSGHGFWTGSSTERLPIERAVLEAVEEVENALAGYVYERDRLEALRRSATAAQQSVELVKTLYLSGLINFQNVLDQERSLFEEQDNLAASEGRVTQNVIQIYRVLGGGW